ETAAGISKGRRTKEARPGEDGVRTAGATGSKALKDGNTESTKASVISKPRKAESSPQDGAAAQPRAGKTTKRKE
ncbi:MAG: hypothetical protein LUD76_07900, partial [Alistipes sp.]|nr:hypothetical protein [Alistipes sp.]